jgi:hypothetical protein
MDFDSGKGFDRIFPRLFKGLKLLFCRLNVALPVVG